MPFLSYTDPKHTKVPSRNTKRGTIDRLGSHANSPVDLFGEMLLSLIDAHVLLQREEFFGGLVFGGGMCGCRFDGWSLLDVVSWSGV